MEIHYECTAEDYADAQIAHMKAVGMYWAFLAVVPAFLVVGIVTFSKNPIFSLLQFVLATGFFLGSR